MNLSTTTTADPARLSHHTDQQHHSERSPDAPRTMPDEKGVKLACAYCIRGHRTSTCSHKDGSKGPLYPVRSKGRPPTQCEVCRKKRKENGRHVRCDCATKPADKKRKLDTSPEQAAKQQRRNDSIISMPELEPLPPTAMPEEQPRGRTSLSLSNLMNPCQCRTKGICTCCREQSKDKDKAAPPKSCCTKDRCCLDSQEDCSAPKASSSFSSGGCCSRSARSPPSTPNESIPSPSGPSIELLLKAVDMSSDFVPKCGCGANCRCAGCLGKKLAAAQALPPDQADCDSCIACDLNLSKPSGIPAVDQWIEAEKTQVLHGGLLTNDTAGKAELVMVHPGCEDCLNTVRSKGIGVLSQK